MKSIKCYIGHSLVVCVLLSIFSCGDMDETYSEFLKGGEITYPGKPDSAQVFPGHLRVQLQWLLISDPNIAKCKVVVDDQEEMEISVERTQNVDTVRTVIENLGEGIHVFDIYTIDRHGNSSVRVEAIGLVYGPNYLATLYNRAISSVTYNDDLSATIAWASSPEKSIGVEISYTDSNGIEQVMFVNPDDNITMLPDFVSGNTVQYKTAFLPQEDAIDVFYAPVGSIVIE